MKIQTKNLIGRLLSATFLIGTLLPAQSYACACGCGVFDVQPGTTFPNGPGGTVWAEYDFMDQNKNWHSTSSASADNNPDKRIRTDFITIGGQYMFNHDWGVMGQVPYWKRNFKTDDGTGVQSFDHETFGDVRLKAVYSGFSPNMSSGITFGVKLANGDYKQANYDRDTQIGTGSTDLLLGGYHQGVLTNDRSWNWFVNGELDQPVAISHGYRPGSEVDATVGAYYNEWSVGSVKIAPVAQVISSYRLSDRGPAANQDNSGYTRAMIAPGIQVSTGAWRMFSDVALPVYQNVTGNQLTAPTLFKVSISRDF